MSNDENISDAEAVQAAASEPAGAAAVPGLRDVFTSTTLGWWRDLFQAAGYRVETVSNGDQSFLRSATNGLAFDIRPGNTIPGSEHFVDITFVALLAVHGTLPLELLDRWNRTRRFGRLFLDRSPAGQEFLVLCSDFSFAGGVTTLQFRSQIDLWDNLIQQFIPWLREELGKNVPEVDTAAAAEAPAGEAEAPVSAPAAEQPVEA